MPLVLVLLGFAWMSEWTGAKLYGPFLPPAVRLDGYDAALLQQTFLRMNYDLDEVGAGRREVPRVILASLPRDLDRLEATEARKRLFLAAMLPLVLQVNEEIAADRRRLLDLQARLTEGGRLAWHEEVWLEQLAEDYGLAEPAFDALLACIDTIPPSLALAQAAEESGWGTSRFARDGNALFGQWSFDDDAMQPLEGRGGYGVRAFADLADAVRAYARNLNSHNAYRDFRAARAEARRAGRPLDGFALAETLTGYSERGHDYVKSLRLIMRANGLTAFDDARFAGIDDG